VNAVHEYFCRQQCCQVLSRLVCHFNKNTPLFGKNTPLIHTLKNSATIPLFSAIFLILTSKPKTSFFSNFNSFIMFACPNIFATKFRYFSATFSKINSGTAIKIPPLLAFIFR
jgi:hypothetical protein